jgi:hypothetical protein
VKPLIWQQVSMVARPRFYYKKMQFLEGAEQMQTLCTGHSLAFFVVSRKQNVSAYAKRNFLLPGLYLSHAFCQTF